MRGLGFVIGVVVLGLWAIPSIPAAAQSVAAAVAARSADLSAQQRQRARTRIEVRPRYTGSYLPPTAYRECVDWFAVEHRPSGTVITPQMHCWWVRD